MIKKPIFRLLDLAPRLQRASSHFLASSIRNGRLIAASALGLIILVTALAMGLQRRESESFSQILDLHLALNRWRADPKTRAQQLPHLCALFRLHPHLLRRFGGEFLSSATLLRGQMKGEGSEIVHWFLAQQARWGAESIPGFVNATSMAARGEYASVATEGEGAADSPDQGDTALSIQCDGPHLLRSYHVARRAACAYLSRDDGIFEKKRESLLRAAQLWPVSLNKEEKKTACLPYATLFASYRTGRLNLLDWALCPASASLSQPSKV